LGFPHALHAEIGKKPGMKMPLNGFGQVAGGQGHAPDALGGQITQNPFQKRLSVYRRHGLGQIWQQALNAFAKATGKDDGVDLFESNAQSPKYWNKCRSAIW
jgi:hypothetical protein